MTHALRFAPEALEQLEALEAYIAQSASPQRAAEFVDAIVDHCEKLRTFPQRGTKRDDLRPGLRTLGFRRRVTILFEVSQETITILGIFYGGRNYEADFGEDASPDE
ncbi:MAG: type II toxin-antitoxin system RelE/ParE family toxin [Rhizobium sp.]|nr:type II toxin-antitoxin system RelE/ParE family toxin [Rhizobium sp.]MCZ8350223.1 type II toxin-antitoxin system RelE/ParE family toxin [Rhizobium sp.]